MDRCCLCSYQALDRDHLEDHIVQKHAHIFKNEGATSKADNGEHAIGDLPSMDDLISNELLLNGSNYYATF